MKRNENRLLFATQVNLYPALAIVVAASVALIVVSVNGQCPPINEAGVACATRPVD